MPKRKINNCKILKILSEQFPEDLSYIIYNYSKQKCHTCNRMFFNVSKNRESKFLFCCSECYNFF